MKTIITKTMLLSLLLTAFAPLHLSAGYITDEALKALCKEHGINESHAHKPKKTRSDYTMQNEDQDAHRSRISCCPKEKEKKSDEKCKQGFNKKRLEILDAKVQGFVDEGSTVGAYTTACIKSSYGEFKEHKFFAGVENVQTQKPFTGDTIIRLASMSKFLGTVGFLKLIDKGVITGFEPLSLFIPEFANTKVMENFAPTAIVNLNNALTATNGSNVLNVNQVAHGFSSGDYIGVTGSSAVQGIPANQINNVHQITVVDANNYTFTVTTLATGTSGAGEGGAIKVNSLAAGVKQSVDLGITYYYVEVPLERPILLYHVMTHELGYCSSSGISGSFGYAANPMLRNTQSGILNQMQIPAGFPNPARPLSSQTIQEWAPALAQVPLLFQPGTDWSYGPTLSILGALIEIIDGRDLETYMQEEVLKPLGMNSSGFFIQNNAPDRAEKLARIMTLYTFPFGPGIPVPVGAVNVPPIAYLEDYFYGLAQPKTLTLIDGGMYSTPNDYLKFVKMMLNNGFTKSGESILSPAMICWLSENHTLENSVYNILDIRPTALTPGKWGKWGLGVGVGTGATMSLPPVMAGCSSRTIGWSGFFNTAYQIDLGNNVGVSTGTNLLGQSIFQFQTVSLNYSALKCINPNNENASGNNPETSTNPT